MIAVEIRDASGLAIAAEEFLDEHIAVIRPEPGVAQLPAIDDIPDEVEMIAFVLAKKIQDRVDLGMAAAEMNVRNPDRAIFHERCWTLESIKGWGVEMERGGVEERGTPSF